MKVIGRVREQEVLRNVKDRNKPQLVAVYGRRRVGKTFLVRSCFSQIPNAVYIEVTGLKGGGRARQLKIFHEALTRSLGLRAPAAVPRDWHQAFEEFSRIAESETSKPVYLFLDELPWLASPRSGCLEELDHYWNTRWSRLPHLTVILCGSAAAWMLEKLIHGKGGLHNRLTRTIDLQPLSLKETKEYLHEMNVGFPKLDTIEFYLCTGGVPYYLDWVEPGSSSMQAIQDLCFHANGVLFREHDSLMESLFENAEVHSKIISVLSAKHYGASRHEILATAKLRESGTISRALKELTAASFIYRYTPFDGERRSYFQLTDPYLRFYHQWIAPLRRTPNLPGDYWFKESQSPRFYSWAGRSFELVCLRHIDQILSALGISGMRVLPSTWRYLPERGDTTGKGAQIDLVLDRADKILTLCEIKFRREPIAYSENIRNQLLSKESVFREVTRTKRVVNSVLINAGGFAPGSRLDSTLVGMIEGAHLFT